MNHLSTQIGLSEVHPDAYPVARVATEFPMRGVDLLTEAQGDMVEGLIVMTSPSPRQGCSRRHADGLLREGICVREGRHGLRATSSFMESVPEGIAIPYRLVMDFQAELRRAGVKV